MSRILFVVPPLVGHINPTVSVGTVLMDRGHDVAWVGHRELLERLTPTGANIYDVGSHLSDADYDALREKGRTLRGAAAFRFLWEDLFWPLAEAMVPGVETAVQAFEPHVVVVDQQTLAGGIVARRHGLPWVTSASTSATLVDPLDALPQLRAWMRDGTDALQRQHGLEPLEDMRSPHVLVAFTTAGFAGAVDPPDHWHFVGPVITDRPETPFPWEALDPDRPKVLVSLGTVSGERGERFFGAVADAVRDADMQVIASVPEGVQVDAPPNMLCRSFLPQLQLLPHMQAVVTHAGHNTTVETLWHGLPMVLAPIRDDQPVVAQQVVNAGAGLRVKFGRVKAPKLRSALDAVLGDPAYAAAAQRVQAGFRAAGGASLAADVIETLRR